MAWLVQHKTVAKQLLTFPRCNKQMSFPHIRYNEVFDMMTALDTKGTNFPGPLAVR